MFDRPLPTRRRWILSIVLLLPAWAAGCRKNVPEVMTVTVDRPPFETARIEYKTASTVTSQDGHHSFQTEGRQTVTLDIAHNRKKIDVEETNKAGGRTTRRHYETLFRDGRAYQISPDAGTAIDFQLNLSTRPVWVDVVPDSAAVATAGHLLGRTCAVLGGPAFRQWVWHGILLKQEMVSGQSRALVEAVSIDEDPKLDPATFDLPKGVRVKTLQQSMSDVLNSLGNGPEGEHAAQSATQHLSENLARKIAASGGEGVDLVSPPTEDSDRIKALTVETKVHAIGAALELYRSDVGHFPSTELGLSALSTRPDGPDGRRWHGPYVPARSIGDDPWGHPLVYRGPATPKGKFRLYSFGPNGQDDGGRGDDVIGSDLLAP